MDRDEKFSNFLESNDCGLLFPGEGSIPVNVVPRGALPSKLVIIESTWSQARHMIRRSRLLQELPRFSLASDQASTFRIRRQPRRECLSSIEATALVLQSLNGARPIELERMLNVFHHMVEYQMNCQIHNNPDHLRRWEIDQG